MPNFLSLFRHSGIFRALRHPTFAIYISAHAVSVVGLWIQRIAIQWLVWTLSGSYAWLGAVALAEALCATVFSVVGGPLADRFDRVKLASGTQSLLTLVALGLAIVTYLDLINLPVLMAFVMVTGAIEGLWTPVRLSIMPNMVPREDMPAAVALTALIFNLAIFVGPAIGAVIITVFSIEGAFLANALSYVGLVVVFLRLKIPNQGGRPGQGSYKGDLFAGLAYVMNTASLRTIVMFGCIFSLFMRPYRELFAGIADEVLQMGAEGLGALASAAGMGAMIGAFFIAGYGRTQALVKVLVTVAFAAIVFLLLFSFANSLWFAMITAGALSLCVTVFGTAAQMMVQMSVADEMRGRVMSLWQAQFRGVPTMAAWAMGLLEPLVGLQAIFIAACGLFLLFLLTNLRHRHLLMDFEK
jgi:MFS family permease